MGAHFASMPLTNATHVCVGTITDKEAAALRADGIETDGTGYYLFLADENDPETPIEILGCLYDSSKADQLLRMMAAHAYA